MRVYVPFPHSTSPSAWTTRHAQGEVPDAAPYGLHHLRDHGFEVTLGDRELTGSTARVARSARYRTGGLELVETINATAPFQRRGTDVTLCYDERTGVPAALLAPRSRYAPVVTGIGWLTSPAEAQPTLRRLAARALGRAATVWTQCSAMVPVLTEAWDLPRPARFVPLGIDTEFYAEQPWDEAGPTVVSAGEDRFRDHDLLVEAVRSVHVDLPDVRLELATALPVTLEPELGTLYTERMDGRMRDLYRRSSVVAVALKPTSTGSGLTVVLEAMASGRPIVVTDNPGVPDYVEHGVTGLLVPPGDPLAFADALASLLTDPARCRRMGEAAGLRAREQFTSAAMSAHLAELLREVG